MRARVTWQDDDGAYRSEVVEVSEDGCEVPLPEGADPRQRLVSVVEEDDEATS